MTSDPLNRPKGLQDVEEAGEKGDRSTDGRANLPWQPLLENTPQNRMGGDTAMSQPPSLVETRAEPRCSTTQSHQKSQGLPTLSCMFPKTSLLTPVHPNKPTNKCQEIWPGAAAPKGLSELRPPGPRDFGGLLLPAAGATEASS